MNSLRKGSIKVLAGLLFGGLMYSLVYTISYSSPKPIQTVVKDTIIQTVYVKTDTISEKELRKYLRELNVKYVDVAVAQMKLESGHATSKIFKENDNLFGMKLATKRPTTALGTKNGYAFYGTWRNSVLDYALYCAYSMNKDNYSSQSKWIDFLVTEYAENNSQYKGKILSLMN